MSSMMRLAALMAALWMAVPSAFATTVTVGVALPLSGSGAAEGEAMKTAIALYTEDLAGTLGASDIAFVYRDDQGDAATAEAIANEFVGMGVSAVVGHPDGSTSQAAAKIYQDASIPMLSPWTTNPRTTKAGDHVYTLNYNIILQGERIGAYLSAILEAKSVLVIHADDDDGKMLKRAVNGKIEKIGLELLDTIPYTPGQVGDTFLADALAPLAEAPKGKQGGGARGGQGGSPRGGKGGRGGEKDGDKGGKEREPKETAPAMKLPVDAIVILGGTEDGAKLMAQLRALKIFQPVIGTDAWMTSSFLDSLAPGEKNLYITTNFSPDIIPLAAKQLFDRHMARTHSEVRPPVSALFAYDAAALVGAAVRDGAADAASIQASLQARSDIDHAYEGLTGMLYFDKGGSTEREPLFMTLHRGTLKPAFTQLKRVQDPRIRRALLKGDLDSPILRDRAVVMVDKIPYYKTAVVYAGLDFYRINEVDIPGQNFDIEFFMWFHFQGDIDVENIDFLNGIYGIEDKVEVLREDLEGPEKYICYKIKGTYLTPYDLRKFPFDTQFLPLDMAHKSRDSNEIILVVDSKGLDHTPVTKIYPEEWTFTNRADYSATYVPSTTFGDPMYTGPASRSEFSVYQANIVVKRILFPYLVTLFLPLGIMIVISLFVFLIHRDQFDARISLTMTALLSILVFHLAQGESLPSVGYLMKADQYFISTYVLMFTLITEVITVNALNKRVDENKLKWFERVFAFAFVTLCLGIYAALTLTAM